MATKLITALVAPLALLALVLVLLATGGAAGAPPAEEGGAETRGEPRGGWEKADAVARLKDEHGNPVGVIRFRYERDAVEVEADVKNVAEPNEFHGFHVHAIGECDPSTTPPFTSAGGHFVTDPQQEHGDHAGDFPVLLVQADGRAEEEFDTDRFRLRQLFDEDGSAVIVHADRDNYANIPSRYGGPDAATRATGDAGTRFACGVVRRT